MNPWVDLFKRIVNMVFDWYAEYALYFKNQREKKAAEKAAAAPTSGTVKDAVFEEVKTDAANG